jgi:hypothetical protein
MAKRYWLSRLQHLEEYTWELLRQEGLLSTGFAELSGQREVDVILAKMHQDGYSGGQISQLGWFLSMSVGDMVVVPHPKGGSVHIYTVQSRWLSQAALSRKVLNHWDGAHQRWSRLHLGFFYQVVPLAINLDRESLAKTQLSSKLKLMQTTISLEDIANELEALVRSQKR